MMIITNVLRRVRNKINKKLKFLKYIIGGTELSVHVTHTWPDYAFCGTQSFLARWINELFTEKGCFLGELSLKSVFEDSVLGKHMNRPYIKMPNAMVDLQ